MDPKGYLQSRTVWGLLILALTTAVRWVWPDADPAGIEAAATHVADLIGLALAAWGTARRPDLSGLIRPREGAQ